MSYSVRMVEIIQIKIVRLRLRYPPRWILNTTEPVSLVGYIPSFFSIAGDNHIVLDLPDRLYMYAGRYLV